MPVPESGQIERFLALMPDLFGQKIRTYRPKNMVRAGVESGHGWGVWLVAGAESGQTNGGQKKKKSSRQHVA